ncbi:MAG: histidinol phosphate phosphatase domain-containing protein [Deferribacteraceae bacterium]|nr:histidinol phosphate phosphatase domain-containing protein [Deferribacteraceae bacterium]
MIVDLHTHTVFSDGALIPAESARRAMVAGYAGIAFTDHADASNIEHILKSILKFKEAHNKLNIDFKVLAGVELTHVHPSQIAELTAFARSLGADIVVVHGEVFVESVAEGTNRAAIEAGVDILAHPGLMTKADVRLAVERGVCLEITTRKGNALANGHVAMLAKRHGAKLVVNNDFHTPGEYVGLAMATKILRGAGLTEDEAKQVIQNGNELFKHKLGSTL